MTAPPDWQPTGNWQSTGNWSAAGGPSLPVLARSVLFADWPPEAIALVARRFRHRPVQAGDVICRQGDSGDEMYVIEHGQFAVDAMIGGRSVRFAELGPGGVFGEIAVLSRRSRSATVTALVPGTIWSLQRADFVDLASQYQGFGAAAGRLASERLAEQSRIADRGAGPSTAWPPAAQPDPETGPARVLEPGYEPGNAPAPRTAPNTISEASARSVAWGDTGTHTIAGGLSAIDLSRLANEPQSVLSLQPKQEAVTIGRDEHNDLVLHDPRVSRRHALVR
ncbi:MAG: cyclic nucleotide-binding domain-containing protein, partial [Chloroflexota bacterium]